ncbi:MAG TPA: flagella basal body P-ring formation protein FlgA [Steroidobacter sp.]|nr:flagella basal body P-ring formation protein FlgA [Steroidobacter sp.]
MANSLPRLVLAAGVLVAKVSFCASPALDPIRAAAESLVRSRLPIGDAKHYVTAEPNSGPGHRTCGSPLDAFSDFSGPIGAKITIGVRCPTGNWIVYVPVSVETETPVLVLRRALPRRARVAPTDVDPQVRRLPGSAMNFVGDAAMLQGHRLRRSLPAGSTLTVDALAPDLVWRGEKSILVATGRTAQRGVRL